MTDWERRSKRADLDSVVYELERGEFAKHHPGYRELLEGLRDRLSRELGL